MDDLPQENVCLNCRADLTVVRCAACCGNPMPSAFATHAAEPAPVAVQGVPMPPTLLAVCQYCDENGEDDKCHPIADIRWDGQCWACEECGFAMHPEFYAAAPRADIAPTGSVEVWRKNSIETWEAMQAMRNSINEYIPMPSLESDLLQGQENSVFCATVAEAVISHVTRPTGNTALVEAVEALKSDTNLERPICCNGVDCGCQGATAGEYAAYQLKSFFERAAPQPTPEVEALVEWWKSQLPKVADFPAPLFAEKIEQTITALARGSVAEKGEG